MTLPNPRPRVLIRTAAPFTVTQWSYESPHNSETLTRAITAALDAFPDGVLLDFTGAVVGDLALHTAFTTLADTGRVHAGNRHLLDLTGLDGRETAAWAALEDALADGFTADDHAELDRERMLSQLAVERALRHGTHVCGLVIQAHGPGEVRVMHAEGQLSLPAADAAALGEALCGGLPLHRGDVHAHTGTLTFTSPSAHFTLHDGFTTAGPATLHWPPTDRLLIREVLLVAAQFSAGEDALSPARPRVPGQT
ncbi:hypothetical protein [Deinococcus ficus]|uniref:Uncharacterized protein n=1 Tax=Deinococcus ficus TaxID=317577 RepID=A0A221T3C8_9DEIO|nr:hypothetical protein [Deinococcus ficus]ASN83360.1 hypothetical protein DFI_19370 [Deinococcus ficus]